METTVEGGTTISYSIAYDRRQPDNYDVSVDGIVASMIGAGGLGYDVLKALRHLNTGDGILAGTAIVFCAMLLDRIIQGRKNESNKR